MHNNYYYLELCVKFFLAFEVYKVCVKITQLELKLKNTNLLTLTEHKLINPS